MRTRVCPGNKVTAAWFRCRRPSRDRLPALRHPAAAALPALLLVLAATAPAAGEVELSGGYTLIGQTASDDRLRESTTGSVDLFFGWSGARGSLDVYVEGNTSLEDRGVATVVGESNADAGTALEPDGNGRIQLSELKYGFELPRKRRITVGLLDPSAYIDATRINNDENLQFLGAPFVNNPTVQLPDYTVGLAYQQASSERGPHWEVVFTGSNGIADNPERSYNELLDPGEEGKGVFAAGEVGWHLERASLRTGAWINTARQDELDGKGDDDRNYGLYSAIDAHRGRRALNFRAGLANREVSLAAALASVSLQLELNRQVFGAALARTWLSSRAGAEGTDDNTHLELYWRFRLAREFYLTPSVQLLRNPGFEASGSRVDDDVAVFSVRLHQAF